jgi:oligopeptide/dipeptide ABC transporter ATP-binding protein
VTGEPILKIEHLVTAFSTEAGRLRAVDDVSFSLKAGQTLGLVGESGCGKSVTALSVMRLLPLPAGTIEGGAILYKGRDLVRLPASAMHRIRGRHISMVFQEPMTALNPVHRIGRQIGEVFRLHFSDIAPAEIRQRSIAMLDKVGIPEPKRRMEQYPHQLSGGMRQRVMIAMALCCEPEILIADEPTTALDVTIQAQILELIAALQAESGMAVIFITHALGVIAEICDHVVVMYGGRVVESAPVLSLFSEPRHPYTQGLLASIPRMEHPRKTLLPTIQGMVPALGTFPGGCRFQNRCLRAQAICRTDPPVKVVGHGHEAACHFA